MGDDEVVEVPAVYDGVVEAPAVAEPEQPANANIPDEPSEGG